MPFVIGPSGWAWACLLFCGGAVPGAVAFPGAIPFPPLPLTEVSDNGPSQNPDPKFTTKDPENESSTSPSSTSTQTNSVSLIWAGPADVDDFNVDLPAGFAQSVQQQIIAALSSLTVVESTLLTSTTTSSASSSAPTPTCPSSTYSNSTNFSVHLAQGSNTFNLDYYETTHPEILVPGTQWIFAEVQGEVQSWSVMGTPSNPTTTQSDSTSITFENPLISTMGRQPPTEVSYMPS